MGSRRKVLAALPAGAKAAARLGSAGFGAVLKLTLARRRAVRHFSRALAAEGLPEEIVRDLADAYPRISAISAWRAIARKAE